MIDHPGLELSLRSAATIAELADAIVARTRCPYRDAFAEVLRARPELSAAYEGDTVRHGELTGQARSTRFASPAAGTYERRFRRSVPRTMSERRISSRDELLPGEVACLRLAPNGAGGGLFAERIAA